jgi:tetratricopeptide (TPR) repeat protein
MGRVALARGAFDEACEWFDQALAHGAPSNVGCDLGFAEYFMGNQETAIRTLQKTTRLLRIEPYRMYMANLILFMVIKDKAGPAIATVRANLAASEADGRAYWIAEAERHPGTPYAAQIEALLAAVPQGG